MQRTKVVLILVSVLCGCSKEISITESCKTTGRQEAAVTSMLTVADDAMNSFYGVDVKASKKNAKLPVIPVKTRGTKAFIEPDVFAVNYDGGGCVILGQFGDDYKVLAVSNNYTYDENDTTSAFHFILSNQRRAIGDNDIPLPDRPYRYVSHSGDTTVVNPLVTVHWHQRAPYNHYCYDDGGTLCLAGCTAIALGQIMSYHQHPTSISLTFSGRPSDSKTLNWNSINNHIPSIWCDTCDQIACLIREIGKKAHMNYGPQASGTSINRIASCLDDFGYSYDSVSDYNLTTINNNILGYKPVFVIGFNSITDKGHAWIADGLMHYYTRDVTYEGTQPYYDYPPQSDWVSTREETYDYLHFNLGWGHSDDYFLCSWTTTSASPRVNGGASRTRYNVTMFDLQYDSEVEFIDNIHY